MTEKKTLEEIFARDIVEVKLKTYDEILESAEMAELNDANTAFQVLSDAKAAGLSSVHAGAVIKVLARKTKISMADLRKGLSKEKISTEDLGNKIAALTLAKYFSSGQHITRIGGDFWVYIGTHWERRSEDQISWHVLQVIQENASDVDVSHSAVIGQAMAILRATTSAPGDRFSFLAEVRPIINTANAELWLDEKFKPDPRPHSAVSNLTSCLDVNYDPYARCEKWITALHQIFQKTSDPAGMARHLAEVFGYLIQPLRPLACWFLFIGGGENGKSKVAEVLQALLGMSGFAAINIQKLEENRFAIAFLIGRLVAIDDDVTKNTRLPDGMLKKMSEQKILSGEFKGCDIIQFLCRATPLLLANDWPQTSDLSDGMRRRANIIPFDMSFKGIADPALFPTIIRDEMPGVLNWAIDGLQRLMARGKFDQPKDCETAKTKWYSASNHVSNFAVTQMVQSIGSWVERKYVYETYREWCFAEGLKSPLGRTKFFAEFHSLGFEVRQNHDGLRCYDGWRMKGLVHDD